MNGSRPVTERWYAFDMYIIICTHKHSVTMSEMRKESGRRRSIKKQHAAVSFFFQQWKLFQYCSDDECRRCALTAIHSSIHSFTVCFCCRSYLRNRFSASRIIWLPLNCQRFILPLLIVDVRARFCSHSTTYMSFHVVVVRVCRTIFQLIPFHRCPFQLPSSIKWRERWCASQSTVFEKKFWHFYPTTPSVSVMRHHSFLQFRVNRRIASASSYSL